MSAEQCRQLNDNNLECCDGDLCNKGECYGNRSSLQFTCRISAQYINLSLDNALFASMEPVRVKGGMSLRNGMWHGLRNDIIMRNLIYAAA